MQLKTSKKYKKNGNIKIKEKLKKEAKKKTTKIMLIKKKKSTEKNTMKR